ncbi:MAG TPA: PEP-CTERM sorting domain-containing protein [Pyrinomonadaceae bacterium]|nr:PEP-CTERM sorting domain-containing protein [Pyrinomonadaceae bacterium]
MHINPNRRLTWRFSVNLISAMLVLFCIAQAAQADEIAVWNFNDSNLNVDRGAGTLISNFVAANILFAAGTTNNARLGDVAGQALSLQGGTGTANNGRHITFNVSTVGFSNIIVSFATQGTSTGFISNQFQYSLDGITFVDFGAPYTPASAFGSVPLVFTLSSIAGLNDNPNAAFRIVFNGATSSTGTNRIDNFVVEGTPSGVPEPATAVLLLSGLSGLYSLRKRKRKTDMKS